MNLIKTFGDFAVSFNSDGYLNATQIAKQFDKRINNYLRSEQTQLYITALLDVLKARNSAMTENQLVIVQKGGNVHFSGTWLHPKLAVDFARWLDPKFAVWCDEQIEQIISGSLQPKPTKSLPNGLTAEQIETVKKLHNALVKSAPKEQQAKIAITLWSAVKSKFGVSYKEVPAEQFAEVLSVMSRVAVDKGVLYGEVLEKQPAPQGVVLTERQMGHFAAGAYMLDLATRRLADLSEPLKMLGARDKGVSAWTIRDEAEIWIKNCRSALEAVLPQMGDNFYRGSVQESLRMMDALAAR